MNPLTLVKRIQNINAKEASLGISDEASWHAKYKDSAYIFVGGIPFDLTEGDLLAVFAQYGEVVDVNLVRDKGTGKSKGFAFLAYEDQRSTTLAVDNLNGAQILGRIIRVDHVTNYKKKEEEDEETERKKREERGVCRAFQKGECNRGAACKFSHDEQRAANTGWGAEEDRQSKRWSHDGFEDSKKDKKFGQLSRPPRPDHQEKVKVSDKDPRNSKARISDVERHYEQRDLSARDHYKIDIEQHRSELKGKDGNYKEDLDRSHVERRSRRYDDVGNSGEDTERKSRKHDGVPTSKGYDNRRDERREKRYESESYHAEKRDSRDWDKRARLHRDGRDEEDRSQRPRR
ncbi:zinc finger CCCH domain-containing protein 25 [Nicotiana tabacum]|uniref:Zinc finger CCCH domain-containing protein 25 n=1 Tax=Nicotiana tabacum TaxID=4097 RepID=A0A1S3XY17_TOBAC|nr:zinc finger CCCH domain-containing protein 25 [Nicotiana tomentosiformis]XP_016444785.1 PREDICTED: zinc finger CCCH domain-containing protein 25-like [Nicotiana tabacum]